jgi:hypothetical protein
LYCKTSRNDLKSNGFLDNLPYESKGRTRNLRESDHIAVYSDYARDLMSILNLYFYIVILKQAISGFDPYMDDDIQYHN